MTKEAIERCDWAGTDPLMVAYHDTEWGVPIREPRALFELLCLEGAQAGLAWITILRKREAFREAFAGFDPEVVARFGARDVQRLMRDAGIVRHQGKIRSAIGNAKRALELRDEFGSLAAYIWSWEPPARRRALTLQALVGLTTSDAAMALSKDLRSRGWTFVGPTTLYAFMQSVGLVNDHLDGCEFREKCEKDRIRFRRPSPSIRST